jgi:hypothetical protein
MNKPMTLITIASLALAIPALGDDSSPTDIRFNRDVRPILSDNCFVCHGNDKGSREADLNLSTRETALAEREGGLVAIKPGDAGASEVFRRISHRNPADRMPLASSNKTLSAAEIEIIERWINEGAQYEPHWSYTQPKRAAVPETGGNWAINAIDHFVARKMEQKTLSPSEEADRRTLIRRLTLDLTGLPPTPDDVQAYLDDMQANAYERVVDRLLASPHYGERMAIPWLDATRFADSWGYHSDNERVVWPYRDYVIDAFNSNKSFDQFTREQIAGDLMPETGLTGLNASTYNHLVKITQEGGAQPKEYMVKFLIDRVSAIGTGWLGTTTACAQCHDHKFDPFTAKDFYSLGAFFADIEEKGFRDGRANGAEFYDRYPIEFVGSKEERDKVQRLFSAAKQAKAVSPVFSGNNLDEFDDTVPMMASLNAWIEALKISVPAGKSIWTPLTIDKAEAIDHPAITVEEKSVIRTAWEIPDKAGSVVIEASGNLPDEITTVQLDFLKEEEGEAKPDDMDEKPWLAFHDVRFVVHHADGRKEESGLDFHSYVGNEHAPNFHAYGTDAEKYAPYFRYGRGRDIDYREDSRGKVASLHLKRPLAWSDGARLEIKMELSWADGLPDSEAGSLPSMRLNVTDHPYPGPDYSRAQTLAQKPALSEEEALELKRYYQRFSEAGVALGRAALDAEYELLNFAENATRTWATKRTDEPRVTRILPRGDWMDESGEIVEPAIPSFLGQLDNGDRRATRLDLANWIVSKDNPLTSRVMVNRFWSQFFGIGLSRILADLGSQGEWPTHPELLDWLAVEFLESGWDVKHMVRLMVTSATYRQSSFANAANREADPLNRYFSRQAQIRLPAEIVRDNALAISGLLVPEIGGKSVRPYQPDWYLSDMNFPRRKWVTDVGEKQYRRGMYTFWQRTRLHPTLQTFDAPSREDAVVGRENSNTPLQALALLNDPTFVEAARAFAENIMSIDGDVDTRIDWALQQALARPARENGEAELLRATFESSATHFAANAEEAAGLLDVGQRPVPDDLDRTTLAAWTAVARVILNLHETVTRL